MLKQHARSGFVTVHWERIEASATRQLRRCEGLSAEGPRVLSQASELLAHNLPGGTGFSCGLYSGLFGLGSLGGKLALASALAPVGLPLALQPDSEVSDLVRRLLEKRT